MLVKDFLFGKRSWFRTQKQTNDEPKLDTQGLIVEVTEEDGPKIKIVEPQASESEEAVYETIPFRSVDKILDKPLEPIERLIGQLETINCHLGQQLRNHDILMSRVKQLPDLLEDLPSLVESQKQLSEKLLNQINNSQVRDQKYISAIEEVTVESAKQTANLTNISHHLAASAETDLQMVHGFNKFNETLAKLNESTSCNTEGILQMSKIFAASERHLNYIINKQSRRFKYLFLIGLGVCFAAIAILAGVILYIGQ